MSGDVLFECDFSVDELAVLADLLEVPALPGGDPDAEIPDVAKGAAARGLLARGVLVADTEAGSVEITQPYATMIAVVLFADEAIVWTDGSLVYATQDQWIEVNRTSAALATWRIRDEVDRQGAAAVARAGAGSITAEDM